MIRIVFKNLEKSNLTEEIVGSRLKQSIEKFPELFTHKLTLTLSMENSPIKAGPDLFSVKLVITGRKFGGIILEKNAPNLYVAMADLSEALLERLNRATDKTRVKNRSLARRVQTLKEA